MKGRIDISQLRVHPEKHELETARYFAMLGHDVEFIPPSYIPDVHRPDILMDGVEWEIKSPTGKSKNTIQKTLRQAVKQSHYIILDLRRINIPEELCISQIQERFRIKTYIKRILVIKKNGECLDYSRRKSNNF